MLSVCGNSVDVACLPCASGTFYFRELIGRIICTVMCRVRTDPGRVWKVLEFNVEIFKALKSLENGMEKSGKILENCNVDLEDTGVCYTVDYRCICQFSCSS